MRARLSPSCWMTLAPKTWHKMQFSIAMIAVLVAAHIASAPALAGSSAARPAERLTADQAFEAAALHVLLAPMFADKKTGMLGSGSAGRHWQAMMTEHMARHIASSGRLRLLPASGAATGPRQNLRPIPALPTTSATPCVGSPCQGHTGWDTIITRHGDTRRVSKPTLCRKLGQ